MDKIADKVQSVNKRYERLDNAMRFLAAPLHDLGKIAVDDSILRKPSGLTDEEYEKMKIHAPYGAKIMSKVLEDVEDKEFVRVAVIRVDNAAEAVVKGYSCVYLSEEAILVSGIKHKDIAALMAETGARSWMHYLK